MALPIYAEFMKRVYADKSLEITQEDVFQMPPGMQPIPNCNDVNAMDAETGLFWENEW
jgi:penicillin-binding protein 1A